MLFACLPGFAFSAFLLLPVSLYRHLQMLCSEAAKSEVFNKHKMLKSLLQYWYTWLCMTSFCQQKRDTSMKDA